MRTTKLVAIMSVPIQLLQSRVQSSVWCLTAHQHEQSRQHTSCIRTKTYVKCVIVDTAHCIVFASSSRPTINAYVIKLVSSNGSGLSGYVRCVPCVCARARADFGAHEGGHRNLSIAKCSDNTTLNKRETLLIEYYKGYRHRESPDQRARINRGSGGGKHP